MNFKQIFRGVPRNLKRGGRNFRRPTEDQKKKVFTSFDVQCTARYQVKKGLHVLSLSAGGRRGGTAPPLPGYAPEFCLHFFTLIVSASPNMMHYICTFSIRVLKA